MKYLKLGIYELMALCIIVGSVIIRLLLISQNWPWTDSDEGTFGIMARHIAYQGKHPIFMYGAFYMGALQAYVEAAMFHLFGPSLFSLRLALLLFFVLFLIALYLLTRTLYSQGLALVTIALLSLGSNYLLTYQLRSYGGYPDTLLFGTLAFLIASWLAISSRPELSSRARTQRYLGYAAWGFVVGLGIWSDQIILPFVAISGTLILLFCWREFLRVIPALCILLCLAIGIFPLIYYNLHALPGQDSLHILLGLQGHNRLHASLLPQIIATTQVSIPTITGNPFCPVNDVPVLRDPTSPHTLSCTLIHSTWGGGYLLLFASAIMVALWGTWQVWRHWYAHKKELETHQNLARHVARLFLLGTAVLVLLLYVASPAPLGVPANHSRYIIGLLVGTPAVLWPLWRYARIILQPSTSKLMRASSIASVLIIAIIGICYLVGTLMVFTEIPTAQAYNKQDQMLITRLDSIHAHHIYSNYWTCNKLAFESQEKIICGVVLGNLLPTHNRYQPYYTIVKSDPRSTYVFLYNDYRVLIKHWVEQNPANYHLMRFEGFYIVQPVNPPHNNQHPGLKQRKRHFTFKAIRIYVINRHTFI